MPLPSPRRAVARRAVDVEALLAAVEIRARDRERETSADRLPPTLPVCSSSSAFSWPRATVPSTSGCAEAPLGQHRARLERVVPRARRACPAGSRPAPSHDQAHDGERRRRPRPYVHDLGFYSSTATTSRGLSPLRNARVCSRSNFGSVASMARKNLSWLAQREPRRVEHRVIRLRQPVQREHRDDRRERREQDRQSRTPAG